MTAPLNRPVGVEQQEIWIVGAGKRNEAFQIHLALEESDKSITLSRRRAVPHAVHNHSANEPGRAFALRHGIYRKSLIGAEVFLESISPGAHCLAALLRKPYHQERDLPARVIRQDDFLAGKSLAIQAGQRGVMGVLCNRARNR